MIIDKNSSAAEEAYNGIYQKLSDFRQFDIPITLMRETARKMQKQNEEI